MDGAHPTSEVNGKDSKDGSVGRKNPIVTLVGKSRQKRNMDANAQ
jgi:hypothetical protein